MKGKRWVVIVMDIQRADFFCCVVVFTSGYKPTCQFSLGSPLIPACVCAYLYTVNMSAAG